MKRNGEPQRINNAVFSGGGRIPPQAIDVERAVIGQCLIDREAFPKTLEIVKADDFYDPSNQRIFDAMTSLFEEAKPIDAITVIEELKRRGSINARHDPAYLTELTMKVSTAANVEYHAKIVVEKSLLRRVIQAGGEMASRAYDDSEDTFELLDDAEKNIFDISERRLTKSFTAINTVLHETFESISGRSDDGLTGITTGFRQIDDLTAGLQASDLIIIAGRPSQGKTALALAIARNAALSKSNSCAVGVFSIEMSENQLGIRLLSSEAKVNSHSMRRRRLSDDEWKEVSRTVGRLATAPIYIDDTASLTILDLRAKARRLRAEKKIGLVIVDYLQLVHAPKNMESREREISFISRSLKALAKELNIPVVALSQLNRGIEGRTDKRPVLSDLRESGAIEQDADVVMFVHRPEMYGIETMKDDAGNTFSSEGMAEIIVGKQRNGPTGVARLAFIKRYAGFENLIVSDIREAIFPPSEIRKDVL